MYVYIHSEPNLWTVGFYKPTNGEWVPERDCATPEEAAACVHYLNGGSSSDAVPFMALRGRY